MSNWWDEDKRTTSRYSGGAASGDISAEERRRNTERDIETAKQRVKTVSNSGPDSLYPFFMATVFAGVVMVGRHLGGSISSVVKAGWPSE